ncbi:hypothetical protein BHE90_000671 [Fusarium euwallaceae]|uniref:Uncharacterized protein n=1 Tax=Fusarium euwallaceae TaxID=1147111 RepID=A0A430M9S9_9HYPO|nr:hypothetical protein BHE90_000671 [Fusarium euwallaceae]
MSPPTQNSGNTGSQDIFVLDLARSDTNDVTATNGAPVATRYLRVIDGKLQYCDRDGHVYPMTTLPEPIQGWLQNECRDQEKKMMYIKWLMDAPLDVSKYGNPSSATIMFSELPRKIQEQDEVMEIAKRSKEERIKGLIEEDIAYWVAKKFSGLYTRLFHNNADRVH